MKNAVPPKVLERYTRQLEALGAEISGAAIFNCGENTPLIKSAVINRTTQTASPVEKLKQEYYLVRKKYIKAYDDLLDATRKPAIDLSRPENT